MTGGVTYARTVRWLVMLLVYPVLLVSSSPYFFSMCVIFIKVLLLASELKELPRKCHTFSELVSVVLDSRQARGSMQERQ